MSWPNFLEVVTNRNDTRWTFLMNYTDLIVGGLDFESDFLCVNQISISFAF